MADFIETFIFKKHMKIITKIIGYLGLSLALGHTPYGQAITLTQINEAFEAGRKESIQNLEKLLQEVDCSDKTSEGRENHSKFARRPVVLFFTPELY